MIKKVFALFALVALSVNVRASDGVQFPRFVEDTAKSGIASVYRGQWQYMAGGGVAVFDCNDDGMPDVFIAGGENRAQLLVNRSARSGPLRFRQRPSGTELNKVTGAYPLDIDGDGKTDLAVLRVGQSRVFRGLGNCRFQDVTKEWSVDGGDAWATAFSATWEAGSSWPTLAFGTYIDRSFENEPWGHCTDNWLLRPDGTHHAFGPRIPLKPSYCALSMLFTDWNRSGTPSLRVANDREYYMGGQEQLWKINPGKPPALFAVGDGWRFQRFWGMGIAGADLNGDGFNEYMVTSMADQRLQFLSSGPEKPNYRDAPFTMGVTAHRPFAGGDSRPSTGWHTQFEDVNNDGLYDLFIVKGNVDQMPDFAMKDPSNLLMQKPDGNFVEGAEKAGLLNYGHGRGGAIADFNMDGKLDAIIVNRNEKARIWRNSSKDLGNWLGVRLQAEDPNHDAIGAWIEVRSKDKVQRREITVGGGHVSGVLGFWHFGLASAPDAEVRVLWPGGVTSEWQKLPANGFYVIQKNSHITMWPNSKPLN